MSESEYLAFEARFGRVQPSKGGEPREADLHEQIWNECSRRGWLPLHGSMAARTHRTEGEEDFVIRADRGRVFWIEVKSATGKLSPAQAAVHAHAAKLGHTSHVVRSLAQFIAIVNDPLKG